MECFPTIIVKGSTTKLRLRHSSSKLKAACGALETLHWSSLGDPGWYSRGLRSADRGMAAVYTFNFSRGLLGGDQLPNFPPFARDSVFPLPL